MTTGLSINNLEVAIEGTHILKGVSLEILPGTVHALMGPNGCGKSSLAHTLMGHPRYEVTQGNFLLNGTDISSLLADKRARLGLFLAFQYPYEIEGVSLFDFMRQAYNALYAGTAKQIGPRAFRTLVEEKMALLKIAPEFVERSVNVGFSGGEKKRAEILQLAVLQPRIAILDEIDSGLDIDALRVVCESINTLKRENPILSIILITHYPRILTLITPDRVHIMRDGRIIRSGGPELAFELERSGYDRFI